MNLKSFNKFRIVRKFALKKLQMHIPEKLGNIFVVFASFQNGEF